MPDIIIVAGPNGAGKSTFIRTYLPHKLRESYVRLDADEIEKQLDASIEGADRRALVAGRLLLERLDDAIDARENLILETTLTLRTYAQRIPVWKTKGYRIQLVYLMLPSTDMSLERVRRRVAGGGHDIPEAAIRRRFSKSLQYLEELYKPIVDEWYVWESAEGSFNPIAAWDIA